VAFLALALEFYLLSAFVAQNFKISVLTSLVELNCPW